MKPRGVGVWANRSDVGAQTERAKKEMFEQEKEGKKKAKKTGLDRKPANAWKGEGERGC